MRKLLILGLMMGLVSGCAFTQNWFKTYPVERRAHMFSDDVDIIVENAECEESYLTDKYDTTNNEIFRCSTDNGNVFIQVESNGNNMEDIKSVKLIWKNWYHTTAFTHYPTIKAKQYAAVFAQMYVKNEEFRFLNSFVIGDKTTFKADKYTVVTTVEPKYFYEVHKAELIFKK